jgi:hypothetical protein
MWLRDQRLASTAFRLVNWIAIQVYVGIEAIQMGFASLLICNYSVSRPDHW